MLVSRAWAGIVGVDGYLTSALATVMGCMALTSMKPHFQFCELNKVKNISSVD